MLKSEVMQRLKHYTLEVLFFTLQVFNVITLPRFKAKKDRKQNWTSAKELEKNKENNNKTWQDDILPKEAHEDHDSID